MSTGYKILVLLHVLCVIGGFGAVAYNALYVSLAQRRPGGGAAAVVEVNVIVSGLAELLIYSALVFGIGAVTASNSVITFSQGWVSAAAGVYLMDVAILHGWIKRNQRQYSALARRLEEAARERDAGDELPYRPGTPPGFRPPAAGPVPTDQPSAVAELRSLEKRISAGWAAFNALVVVAVYLMIFKPGS